MVLTKEIQSRFVATTTRLYRFLQLQAPHFRNFWRGGLITIVIMIGGKAISLGWKLLIVKLGPEVLGTTQLLLTALTVLSSFALFGMPTSLGRFASIAWRQGRYHQAEQFLFTSLKWCGVISCVLALGCWLAPNVIASVLKLPALQSQDIQYLGIALPFAVASELAWSYLTAQRQIGRYAVSRYLLLPTCRLLLLGALMSLQLPVTQIIFWHLVGAVIVTGIVSWVLGGLPVSGQGRSLEPILYQRFVKYSASIAGSFLLFIIYGSADVLLLNHFSTLTQVGLLSAVLVFTELADVFFTSFLNLFQSFLSSFHEDRLTGLKFTVVTSLSLMIGGLVVTGLLTFLKVPLISMLFGSEYLVIGQFITVALILKTVESSLIASLHHYLDFYGYVKATIGLMALGLLVKIIVGWWLISQYSLAGVFYTQGVSIAFQLVGCALVIGSVIGAKNARSEQLQHWLKVE